MSAMELDSIESRLLKSVVEIGMVIESDLIRLMSMKILVKMTQLVQSHELLLALETMGSMVANCLKPID